MLVPANMELQEYQGVGIKQRPFNTRITRTLLLTAAVASVWTAIGDEASSCLSRCRRVRCVDCLGDTDLLRLGGGWSVRCVDGLGQVD